MTYLSTFNSLYLDSPLRRIIWATEAGESLLKSIPEEGGLDKAIKFLEEFSDWDYDYPTLRTDEVAQAWDDLFTELMKSVARSWSDNLVKEEIEVETHLQRIIGLNTHVNSFFTSHHLISQKSGDFYYGGLDTGGTSSKAVITDTYGNIIGCGEAGPSMPRALDVELSVENVLKSLENAINDASSNLRIDPSEMKLERVCVGSSGLDSCELFRDYVSTLVKKRGEINCKHIVAIQDSILDWYSIFHGEPGIMFNGGTGDLILGYFDGKDSNNNLLGGYDEWITIPRLGGRLLVYHAAKRILELGLKPEDSYLLREWENAYHNKELFERYSDERSFTEILKMITRSHERSDEVTIDEVAALAPLIIQVAKNGDVVATQLINEAVKNSCKYVRMVAEEIELDTLEKYPVCCIGSVLRDPYVYSKVKKEIMETNPRTYIVEPKYNTEYAGAVIARENIQFY